MKAATSTITPEIDVQALRVGMFVHLGVGWMSHPVSAERSFQHHHGGAGGDDPLDSVWRGCVEPAGRAISSLLDGGALTGRR